MPCGLRVAHLYDRGILFAALNKLVVCELGILVTVHITENFVHPLFAKDEVVDVGCLEGTTKDVPSQGCPRPSEV